jgi:hypothetical protein
MPAETHERSGTVGKSGDRAVVLEAEDGTEATALAARRGCGR